MRALALILALLAAEARAEYRCDAARCVAPACRCASLEPPVADPPVLLTLTFDDAVNEPIRARLGALLEGLANPNGCPVPVTYYLSGEHTDRRSVCELHRAGHELANHTRSHATGVTTSYEAWLAELDEARAIIESAGVPADEVRGFRAPFLAPNADAFLALAARGYLYDSSVPESTRSLLSSGIDRFVWPYTLDHGFAQRCWTTAADGRCPDLRLPGLWELPMWTLVDVDTGIYYAMDPRPFEEIHEGRWVERLLDTILDARRRGNRAPLGIFLHAAWLFDDDRAAGLRAFLGRALAAGDTWMITAGGLVEYMRDPRSARDMRDFAAVACPPRGPACVPPAPEPEPTPDPSPPPPPAQPEPTIDRFSPIVERRGCGSGGAAPLWLMALWAVVRRRCRGAAR